MRHDGGRQRIEADHVCNRQIARYSPVWRSSCRRGRLNYIAVDNVGPWQKPVGKLFLAVHRGQIVPGKELKKINDDMYKLSSIKTVFKVVRMSDKFEQKNMLIG